MEQLGGSGGGLDSHPPPYDSSRSATTTTTEEGSKRLLEGLQYLESLIDGKQAHIKTMEVRRGRRKGKVGVGGARKTFGDIKQ